MKIKTGYMIFALIAFCMIGADGGCKQEVPLPPPPNPTIQVERIDSLKNTGITVYFKDHYIRQGAVLQTACAYVELPTTEAIAEYRQQVEFLLLRLEEAENRMNVHEQPQQQVVEGKQ